MEDSMKVKIYEKLPEEAKMIRTKVFVKEQGFENEFDEKDSISIHIVLYDLSKPVATCRFYHSEERQCYVIGRIAVLKEFRGLNVGSKLLEVAEKEILDRNGSIAELSAQVRAAAFYEKNGYHSLGDVQVDEGCRHVWMRKKLKECLQ